MKALLAEPRSGESPTARLLDRLGLEVAWYTRLGHGSKVHDLLEFRSLQNSLLDNQFLHGQAGGHRFLGQLGRLAVADPGGQRGNQSRAPFQPIPALLLIGLDSIDTSLRQNRRRVSHDEEREQDVMR